MDIQDQYLDIQLCDKHHIYSIWSKDILFESRKFCFIKTKHFFTSKKVFQTNNFFYSIKYFFQYYFNFRFCGNYWIFLYPSLKDFNKYHWWGLRSEPKRLIKFDLNILWTLKPIFQQHTILLILRVNTRYNTFNYYSTISRY